MRHPPYGNRLLQPCYTPSPSPDATMNKLFPSIRIMRTVLSTMPANMNGQLPNKMPGVSTTLFSAIDICHLKSIPLKKKLLF